MNKNENKDLTHFGNAIISKQEKSIKVNNVFRSVSDNYDLMNDIMSIGTHRLWKDAMVNWISPIDSYNSFCHIDIAGGTGDIAYRLLNRFSDNFSSHIVDLNPEMINFALAKAERENFSERISFTVGNAENLPIKSNSIDLVTIAFGIRNVVTIENALREVFRVLKYGGRFICLEFSDVSVPLLDKIYDYYSFNVIPELGRIIAGDLESYQYLVESIRRFPNQKTFCEMIEGAGFDNVKWRNLSGGIATLHSAWRL
jgi:demethylmenaquinone methyltransferase/2-methoxy-6-polyprenyl-1,4-benzoquinol methylase